MLKTNFKVEQVAKKLETEYKELELSIPREVDSIILQLNAAYATYDNEVKLNIKIQSSPVEIQEEAIIDFDDLLNEAKDYISFTDPAHETDGSSKRNIAPDVAKINEHLKNFTKSSESRDKTITALRQLITVLDENYKIKRDKLNREREKQKEIYVKLDEQLNARKIDVTRVESLLESSDNNKIRIETLLKSKADYIKDVEKISEGLINEKKKLDLQDSAIESLRDDFLKRKGDLDKLILNISKQTDKGKQTKNDSKSGTDSSYLGTRIEKAKIKSEPVTSDTILRVFDKTNVAITNYKTCLKSVLGILKSFYNNSVQSYIHDIRKKAAYIKSAGKQIKQQVNAIYTPNDSDVELDEKYNKQLAHAEKLASEATKIKQQLTYQLERIDEVVFAILSNIKAKCTTELPRDMDIVKMEKDCQVIEMYVKTQKEKLNDLFNNEVTIMDIVLDSNFMAMYGLKVLNYGLLVGAIFLTEKIFSSMYMQQVYANNGDPPNLMIMIAIFIAIDVAFSLFLGAVLWIVSLIAEKQGNRDFIINNRLIKMFCLDYIISTLVLFVLISIIAVYMQQKVYFRYKTEGLRAIRAFGDMTMSIAPVIMAVPYFAIF